MAELLDGGDLYCLYDIFAYIYARHLTPYFHFLHLVIAFS